MTGRIIGRLRQPRCVMALLAASAMSGCASYAPHPLNPASVALAAPDMNIVSADARTIQRPFLTPQSIDLYTAARDGAPVPA